MNSRFKSLMSVMFVTVLGVSIYALGVLNGQQGEDFIPSAVASEEGEVSPVKARPSDVYFPNTEDLLPDEMRVIA